MGFDIETEERRHQDGWKGFVLFTVLSAGAVTAALLLMAAFLL